MSKQGSNSVLLGNKFIIKLLKVVNDSCVHTELHSAKLHTWGLFSAEPFGLLLRFHLCQCCQWCMQQFPAVHISLCKEVMAKVIKIYVYSEGNCLKQPVVQQNNQHFPRKTIWPVKKAQLGLD